MKDFCKKPERHNYQRMNDVNYQRQRSDPRKPPSPKAQKDAKQEVHAGQKEYVHAVMPLYPQPVQGHCLPKHQGKADCKSKVVFYQSPLCAFRAISCAVLIRPLGGRKSVPAENASFIIRKKASQHEKHRRKENAVPRIIRHLKNQRIKIPESRNPFRKSVIAVARQAQDI